MNCSVRAAVGAMFAGFAIATAPASPAAAEVTVSPAVAPRGGPAQLSFRLTEDRPGAHTTKVELIPPAASPIAEIYPMSVAGWAPVTAFRKLDKPVGLIHGTTTSSIVSSITWTRSTTAKIAPGTEPSLGVSLGPMPQTENVAFTVVQTYSDGTVVRWGDGKPAAVVALINAPELAGGQHGAAAEAIPDAVVEEITEGGAPWLLLLLGAVLVAGLAFTAEGLALFALERRPGARTA